MWGKEIGPLAQLCWHGGYYPFSALFACFDQNSEQNILCDWFDVCKLIVAEKGDSVARKTGAQSFRSKEKPVQKS
jgi:hypothetical protein